MSDNAEAKVRYENGDLMHRLQMMQNEEKIREAVEECKEMYKSTMDKFLESGKETNVEFFQEQHKKQKKEVLHLYHRKSENIQSENVQKYLYDLDKACNDHLAQVLERIQLKSFLQEKQLEESLKHAEVQCEARYKKMMQSSIEDSYLDFKKFNAKHKYCSKESIKYYIETVEGLGQTVNSNLKERIKKNLGVLKMDYFEENEKNREAHFSKLEELHNNLISDLKAKYDQFMVNAFKSHESYFEDEDLNAVHLETKQKITQYYLENSVVKKRKESGTHSDVLFTENLDTWFTVYKNENLSVRNKMMREEDNVFFQIYQSCKAIYEDTMSSYINRFVKLNMSNEEFEQKHLLEKQTALDYYQKQINQRPNSSKVPVMYKEKLNRDLDELLSDFKNLLQNKDDHTNVILECHLWDIFNEAQDIYRKQMKTKLGSNKVIDENELKKEHDLALDKAQKFYKKKIAAIENIDVDEEAIKLTEIAEEFLWEFTEINKARELSEEKKIEILCLNALIASQDYYGKLVENFLGQKKSKKKSEFVKEQQIFRAEVLKHYEDLVSAKKHHKSAKLYYDSLQEYMDSVKVFKMQKKNQE